MKSETYFILMALVSFISVKVSAKTPEIRSVGFSVSNNLTSVTNTYVQSQQTLSMNAIRTALSTLGSNYYNPIILTQYNWFTQHYTDISTQFTNIKAGLMSFIGVSTSVNAQNGVKLVSDAMTKIIATLNQANQYYQGVDSTAASMIQTQIQGIVTLQGQIIAGMSCANTVQTMANSCNDSLFTLVAQFVYQAATLMRKITVGWTGACSSNPIACAGKVTTTTTTTTTTNTPGDLCVDYPDFVHFNDRLATIESNELAEARAELNSQYWKTNIPSFPSEITRIYNAYQTNLTTGTVAGKNAYPYMRLVDPAIDKSNDIYVYAFDELERIIVQHLLYFGSFAWPPGGDHYIKRYYYEVFYPLVDPFIKNMSACETEYQSLEESCGCKWYTAILDIIQASAIVFNDYILTWSEACQANLTLCIRVGRGRADL